MIMSNQDTGESQKKSSLESMSQEELVSKCKNLLSIAQRAKKARDDALEDNNRLKREIENFNSRESGMDLQLDNMTKTISSLTDQKLKLMKQIDEVGGLNGNLKQNLWEVRQELVTMKNKIEQLESENKNQSSQISSLENELKKEKTIREQLEYDKNNLNDDLEKLTENTEQMKIICKQISEERISLEKELEEVKNTMSNLDKEKSKWNSFLSSKCPDEKFTDVNSWIDFLNKHTEEIVKKYNDKDEESSKCEESYKNEIERLNIFNGELNSDKNALEDEILELKTQNNKLFKDLEELNVSRESLLKKLDEVRIETKTLIENSEKLSEENSLLRSEKSKLNEELNDLLLEKSKLIDSLENVKFDNQELIIENENLNKNFQFLTDSFNQNKIEYDSKNIELNNIMHEFKKCKDSNLKLVEETSSLQEKLNEAYLNNEHLNKNIFKLNKLNLENENNIKSFVEEIKIYKENLDKLKQENENFQKLVANLDEKEINNKKENIFSSDIIVMKKDLINLLEYLISKSNQDASNIVEIVENENSDFSSILECLKESVNKLIDERNKYKTNLNEFNHSIEEINYKLKENERIIEILKIEKQQVKDLLEEKVTENNSMINSLESLKLELENISYHMRISDRERSDESLKEIEIIKLDNDSLLEELNVLKNDYEKTLKDLDNLKIKHDSLGNEMKITIEQNNILQSKNKSLVVKNENFMKDIENLNNTISKIELDFDNLKSEKNIMNERLQELTKEKESLIDEKHILFEENKTLIENKEKCTKLEDDLNSYIDTNKDLNNRCIEMEKYMKSLMNNLETSINENIKLFSSEEEFRFKYKDGNEFLDQFKHFIELIKVQFKNNLDEIVNLKSEIHEKAEHIVTVEKETDNILHELNVFKNNLNIEKFNLNKNDSIEDKEISLKRINECYMLFLDLSEDYANSFNIDKPSSFDCVKNKIINFKNNKWILNNETEKNTQKEQSVGHPSCKSVQTEESMEKEEAKKDKSNVAKPIEYENIIKEKEKEVFDLQDKLKETKMLAMKLKKRVSELDQQLKNERKNFDNEKNKLKNLSAAAKNAQTLQQECDRLTDELEETKRKMKNIRKSSDILEESETKLRQRVQELECKIQSNDSEASALKNQLEISQASFRDLKKEFDEKLKEKIAQDVIVKELEKELLTAQEKMKSLKLNLDQAKQQSHKRSVLSLEMEDYEKSVKDLTAQVSQEKDRVKQLEDELESKNSIQNSLQEQISFLEERVMSEEERANLFSAQLVQTRKNLETAEKLSMDREKQISEITRQLETEKSNKDILALQLTELTAENQKQNEMTRLQNEALVNKVAKLESDLQCSNVKRQQVEEEINRINKEFEAYKVRAQSVLRQRGVSAAEREAKEECNRLQELHNHTKLKLELTVSELERFKSELNLVNTEKESLEKKYDNLNNILLQRNKELDRQISEHRSYKISSETLIQCYKAQLEEKEQDYQKQLNILREQLNTSIIQDDNNVNTTDKCIKDATGVDRELVGHEIYNECTSLPMQPPLIEREDGEGSEGNESSIYNSYRQQSNLIPLDKLLNSPEISEEERDAYSVEKLDNLRAEITASNIRVQHLTALLSESEKDSARKEEQISVLKEEIRRLQRCIERQPHTQNTEYLKNVVFKFVTLHNGDERSRLVPVLETILKLSPEEHRQLAAVAKGESDQSSSWGMYLPSWSSLQS